MATDPYHAVQQEIQTSLQAAATLRSSYLRIRSTAREDNEELAWARNELKATLAALEADLEDLEESVKIVEDTGARMFGLEESEVIERRHYVFRVQHELKDIRAEIAAEPGQSQPALHKSRPTSTRHSPTPSEDDHQARWAQEEQQMIMQRQDHTIDSIAGTLTTLAQQAGLMGQEIEEHNEILDDLERGVDNTDAKLDRSMKRLKKFIRDTEETKSGWCIAILIVILLALLLAAILI